MGSKIELTVTSLADQVYELLEESIISGERAPGSRLIEAEVADSYGISRAPVREVILKLAHHGLVEIVPRRGAVVVSHSEATLGEVLEVREVLEGLAARRAAVALTESELEQLEAGLKRVQAEVSVRHDSGYPNAVFDFHETLYRAAGIRVRALLASMRPLIKMARRRARLVEGRSQRALDEHWEILAALQRRDAAAAEGLMRSHIRTARSGLLER